MFKLVRTVQVSNNAYRKYYDKFEKDQQISCPDILQICRKK